MTGPSWMHLQHSQDAIEGLLVRRNAWGGIDGVSDLVQMHSDSPAVGGPFWQSVQQTVIALTPVAVTANLDIMFPVWFSVEHRYIQLAVDCTTADVLGIGNMAIYDIREDVFYPRTRLVTGGFTFGALGFRGPAISFTPAQSGVFWIGVNVTNAATAAWGENNPIGAIVPNFGYTDTVGLISGFTLARVGAFPATYPAGLTAITTQVPVLFHRFVQSTE